MRKRLLKWAFAIVVFAGAVSGVKTYFLGWSYMFSGSDASCAAAQAVRDGQLENDETRRLMVYAIWARSKYIPDPMSMCDVVHDRRMKVRPGKSVWVPHMPGLTHFFSRFFGTTSRTIEKGYEFVAVVKDGTWKPPKGFECAMWYSLGVQTPGDSRWFKDNLVFIKKVGWYYFYRPKNPEHCPR